MANGDTYTRNDENKFEGTNQMTRITSAGNVTRLRGHTGTRNTFTGTIIKAQIRRRDCRRKDRRELTR